MVAFLQENGKHFLWLQTTIYQSFRFHGNILRAGSKWTAGAINETAEFIFTFSLMATCIKSLPEDLFVLEYAVSYCRVTPENCLFILFTVLCFVLFFWLVPGQRW